ncbi:MAG: tRNA (N6-isopentenyl adenosine(37)-C2)-methylthiotransferase MiaB [Sedimentisphaerales bacterium]|nr:tRNA (N6-isopentenyl adenosine(37)-C2)-methylthiotransferase MiaB [Sedimentisphaerales bacterium]
MAKLDTALVTGALKTKGYSLTEHIKEADVVLLNTCSVREHAEQKVLSHIGQLKHIKKQKPDLVVGIIGCMAQRLGDDLLEDGTVDIVAGPGQIPEIIEMITKAISEKSRQVSVADNIRKAGPQNPALEDFESVYDTADKDIPGQAFVRVMRGCDNFCTYCIVPYVRGPEISRPVDKITEQVKRLADEGVKLVTLLGQAVNKYKSRYIGTAGDKTYSLADLLYKVSEIDGIEWIRFVTSYPQKDGFIELMQAMADLPKVCNYLHMPAQSGSDRILKAMNRHYTAAEYLEMLDAARQIVPDITIAGDFIVGFPDESDKYFEQTVELVKKARYKNCFVFKYSNRPGTTADNRLQDNIPLEVKKQRNYRLLEVQEKISEELSAEFLDKEVAVLVEGPSKKPHLNAAESQGRPQLVGRTADDWIVVFNGDESLAGQFAKIKITKTSPLTLFGNQI